MFSQYIYKQVECLVEFSYYLFLVHQNLDSKLREIERNSHYIQKKPQAEFASEEKLQHVKERTKERKPLYRRGKKKREGKGDMHEKLSGNVVFIGKLN